MRYPGVLPLLIAVSALTPTSAHADDATVQPTVEVTASRVAETTDASLADVSVITRTDIERSGALVFHGATTLAALKRDPKELVAFLFRDNSFPNGVFLMTGTGIVPDDSFTLAHGDIIRISIDRIGTLKNVVA